MTTIQERVYGAPPPPSWTLGKLHRVLRVRKNFKNTGMREDNLLSLSYGRIIRKDIDAAEGLLPESFETYQIVEPGNIVMRLTDLQNDKRSLRQALVHERGIITSAYDALEVGPEHDPRFWAYFLLALDLAKYYYSLGGGVRQSINFADFPNEWLGIPDLETQRAIADFLSRETDLITELIEKKRRQVELLSEKRSIALEQMLFEPALKGRGRLMRLKYLAKRISKGTTPSTIGADLTVEGTRFLRAENVHQGGVLDEPALYISEETDYVLRRSSLEAKDILVVIAGATTGKVGVIERRQLPANLNQAVSFIRLWDPSIAYIVAAALQTQRVQAEVKLTSVQAAQPNLAMEDLGPVPPKGDIISTQEKIRHFNERHLSITQGIQASIERLVEFRSAVITAAVCGKVDISTWRKRGSTLRHLEAVEAGQLA
ncbi:MAG: restriction endonuclease subunit S [Acidobacteriota bacterium]